MTSTQYHRIISLVRCGRVLFVMPPLRDCNEEILDKCIHCLCKFFYTALPCAVVTAVTNHQQGFRDQDQASYRVSEWTVRSWMGPFERIYAEIKLNTLSVTPLTFINGRKVLGPSGVRQLFVLAQRTDGAA